MCWPIPHIAALLALGLVNAFPQIPHGVENVLMTRELGSNQIITELKPQLSPNAVLLDRDDAEFKEATTRWSAYKKPNFTVVVEPGSEADVAKTVSYANAKGIDFMAVNKGHGATKTLANLQRGLQISLKPLQSISISSDGGSARIQGGVDTGNLISTLWEAGKVSATTSCSCVGTVGAALGGGHGRYDGFHGLIIDNILSMNVVLANGSAVTVSKSKASDLWWGMRGAGHNFGIVTSLEIKIYERTVEEWFYSIYTYTQDKLEALFGAVNSMVGNGTQPRELMNNIVYTYVDEISTSEPVILCTIYYIGSAKDAAKYVAPFDDIGPVSKVMDSVPYPDLLDATGTGYTSAFCQDGLSHIQRPLGLLTYNIQTNRKVYELFKKQTTEEPAFRRSIVLFEAYSLEAVKAVDPDTTAYPHRDDNLLVAAQMIYTPNSALDSRAIRWSQDIIDLFYAGEGSLRKRTTYVNYAYGDEPQKQIYGYEPWRLKRLTELKKKYDPKGRFNYYNPIVA